MADNLDYTDITPAAGDEDLLRFPLNRSPSAEESSFIASRKLTVSGDTIEVRVQGQFEADPRDAVRTAIGRVDLALRMLAEGAASGDGGAGKPREQLIAGVARAKMERKTKEAQGRAEEEERERNRGTRRGTERARGDSR